MYVCICNAVTQRQVEASVEAGSTTFPDLQMELGVGLGCGCCTSGIEQLLHRVRVAAGENVPVSLSSPKSPSAAVAAA